MLHMEQSSSDYVSAFQKELLKFLDFGANLKYFDLFIQDDESSLFLNYRILITANKLINLLLTFRFTR